MSLEPMGEITLLPSGMSFIYDHKRNRLVVYHREGDILAVCEPFIVPEPQRIEPDLWGDWWVFAAGALFGGLATWVFA